MTRAQMEVHLTLHGAFFGSTDALPIALIATQSNVIVTLVKNCNGAEGMVISDFSVSLWRLYEVPAQGVIDVNFWTLTKYARSNEWI